MKIIYVNPEGKYRSSTLETKYDKSDFTEQLSSSAVELEISTSPDGKLMASGDRGGNLRVHDLNTFKKITYQEAPDAEILTIEFTYRRMPGDRDRILHVFDVNNSFQLIQTLDDYSSSITAIKFINNGATVSGECRLNVYHIDMGKNMHSYKSDTTEEVNTADQESLFRISLNPDSVHAVTGEFHDMLILSVGLNPYPKDVVL
ncbi:24793_t:CDS:2, partial [Dentiscutata erythropus]